MSVIGVNHVQVNVPLESLAAARAFYVGFLGLKEVARPSVFKSKGLWLNAGCFEIHIGLEDHAHRHGTRAHIAFEVEDLSGWRRKIEANGWPITEQPKSPATIAFTSATPSATISN